MKKKLTTILLSIMLTVLITCAAFATSYDTEPPYHPEETEIEIIISPFCILTPESITK